MEDAAQLTLGVVPYGVKKPNVAHLTVFTRITCGTLTTNQTRCQIVVNFDRHNRNVGRMRNPGPDLRASHGVLYFSNNVRACIIVCIIPTLHMVSELTCDFGHFVSGCQFILCLTKTTRIVENFLFRLLLPTVFFFEFESFLKMFVLPYPYSPNLVFSFPFTSHEINTLIKSECHCPSICKEDGTKEQQLVDYCDGFLPEK